MTSDNLINKKLIELRLDLLTIEMTYLMELAVKHRLDDVMINKRLNEVMSEHDSLSQELNNFISRFGML